MSRGQAYMVLVVLAGVLVFWGWQVRAYLRLRRLRRQWVEDGRLPGGRLPAGGVRRGDRSWVLTIAAAATGLALLWLAWLAGQRLGLSPFWRYVFFCAVAVAFAL